MGRSIPALVPIPSSPRRRAPSSVASAASRYSWPRRPAPRRPRRRGTQLDPADRHPRRAGGHGEADVPLGRVLGGPGEHLAGLGMLRRPSELIQVRGRHVQAQVGALGLDADLARLAQPRDQRGLAARTARATRRPGRAVQEQRPGDERGVVASAHPGLLGQRRGRHQRHAPAQQTHALAERRPARVAARGDQRRVDAGQLAGVGGRLDADERVQSLGQRQLDRRGLRQVAVPRVRVEVAAQHPVERAARTASRRGRGSRRAAPAR